MHEHVCVFQAEALCSPRVDASACCRSAGASEAKPGRRDGWMAGWLFERAKCVHVCCLLLEREIESTRTCELTRGSGGGPIRAERSRDRVVGEDVERDGLCGW